MSVVEENNRSINLSGISRLLGTRVATMWSYHHGKAKWPADLWLLSLILTGGCKVDGKTLTITIPLDILDPAHPIGFSDQALRHKSNKDE